MALPLPRRGPHDARDDRDLSGDPLSGRAVGALAVAALLFLAPAWAAGPPPQEVNIEFSDYRPPQLDVLPGETVDWTNVSQRTHTVTSASGLFDSGPVQSSEHFTFRFDAVGTYRYYCTIHPNITGQIEVRRVILDGLPTAVLPVGTRVEVTGRTADLTQPVRIERVDSASATTAATAMPAADGTWKTEIEAKATGDYRAASGADLSEARRLLVAAQHVLVQPTRKGVSVNVTPSAPYSRFLVELYRRERFGWWPIASGRVDYLSRAEVRIRRPARVRIVLVDADHWTPLATSRVLVLNR